MPASKETRSPLLDPLHSPGSDVPAQPQQLQLQLQQLAELPALVHSTLSGPTFRQNQATAETMAKTKRRMFSSPLLRRSATASSAAAASAASKIKSNLSTALKRSATNTGSGAMPSNDDNKANVDRAPTIPSLSTSSTESSAKQHSNKMFSMPSMMRIRTGSKEEKTHKSTESDGLKHSTEDKSEQSNNDTSSSSETEGDNDVESTSPEASTQSQKSAINSASRFVMGMPTLLRRAVSNNTPASAATTQKKSPDTSANSTPRGQFPEDDFEENERHSLLMMMQVPESQRNSLLPLMAVGEAW